MHGAKNVEIRNVYCTLLICSILGGVTQTHSWKPVVCSVALPSFPASCIYETTTLDV